MNERDCFHSSYRKSLSLKVRPSLYYFIFIIGPNDSLYNFLLTEEALLQRCLPKITVTAHKGDLWNQGTYEVCEAALGEKRTCYLGL